MRFRLPSREIVLVGAGHTHLHVVRRWRDEPLPDTRLTLVSPYGIAVYSGMLPGTIAGQYDDREMQIDLHRLTASCGVRLIVEPMTGLDPQASQIQFTGRPPLHYDIASIGIGSVPAEMGMVREHPEIVSVKPMQTFLKRLEQRLEQCSGRGGPDQPVTRIAVVGGGSAGFEIVCCLDALLNARAVDAKLVLVDSGETILDGYTPRTIRLGLEALAEKGIEIRTNFRVTGYAGGQLQVEDGSSLPADLVVWTVAAAPPPGLERILLPKAEDGFLAVRTTQQTVAGYPVFIVGDTATRVDDPVPKAGVFAVREGPVLFENLRRLTRKLPPLPYEPQRGFLSLMNTGDGQALAEWKGFSWRHRWMWKFKDHIDRRFVAEYRDYQFTGHAPGGFSVPAEPSLNGRPASVLSGRDGTALLDAAAGKADVLAVDFFRGLLDDPYLVGRVAAVNALGNIWATGAEPVGAVALLTVPDGLPQRKTELLDQVMAGGERELNAAGAKLLGSRAVTGDELTVGYSVVGRLDGRPSMRKAGLRPGDRLVLTKPLGSGALLAAHRRAACWAEWMQELLDTLLRNNAAAAATAREFDLTIGADVTGQSLADQLLQMLDASKVSAQVHVEALPLLDGFASVVSEGFLSGSSEVRDELLDRLEILPDTLCDEAAFQALFDPQTSGGLLIGVPAESAEAFVEQLHARGDRRAAVICEVLDKSRRPVLHVVE